MPYAFKKRFKILKAFILLGENIDLVFFANRYNRTKY